MKQVLLSADGEISVFTVPDPVAENLEQYCLEFCTHWLYESPDAAKYRVKMGTKVGVRFDEKDFIEYLNQHVCHEQSSLVTTLTEVDCGVELPEEYAGLPYFNF